MLYKIYKDNWNIFVANDYETCMKILFDNDIAILVSDYSMPEIDGVSLLIEIKEKFPEIRRILMSADLQLDFVVNAINDAKIDKVVYKPIDKDSFEKLIEDQLDIFNKKKEDLITNNLLKKNLSIYDNHPHEDEILELMINITESSKINDFINKYVNVIEGIRSLCFLNMNLFFQSREKYIYNNVMKYISDLEVFANQFDQKLLTMYLNVIKAYFELYNLNLDKAMQNYKASLFMLQWLSVDFIDQSLVKYISDFPLLENYAIEENRQKIINEIQMDDKNIMKKILELVDININNLVNISQTLFSQIKTDKKAIEFIIIVKNELPIYERALNKSEKKLTLISGFVVALSNFLQEVVSGKGDIDTITHDNGVILFHKIKDIKYILLSANDDARFRLGLRQFAQESYHITSKIPKSEFVNEEENKILEELGNKLFKI